MNKPKFIFKAVVFLLILSVTNSFAQTETKQSPADPCYEVILQILVGSNIESEKSTIPPALAGVVKKLKALYAFSNYRLTATILERSTNYIEYKSVLRDLDQSSAQSPPVFSEWSLKGFRNVPNSNARNILQFDSFRFGARIPILSNAKDESGKTSPSVNYEGIGMTTMRFSLNEAEPTIVGSLATSKNGEMMFLVLTVKSAE